MLDTSLGLSCPRTGAREGFSAHLVNERSKFIVEGLDLLLLLVLHRLHVGVEIQSERLEQLLVDGDGCDGAWSGDSTNPVAKASTSGAKPRTSCTEAISTSWRRTSSKSYPGPGEHHDIKTSAAEVTQTTVAHTTTPVTQGSAETTLISGKSCRGRAEIPDGVAGADAGGAAGHGWWRWERDRCRRCAGSRFL